MEGTEGLSEELGRAGVEVAGPAELDRVGADPNMPGVPVGVGDKRLVDSVCCMGGLGGAI